MHKYVIENRGKELIIYNQAKIMKLWVTAHLDLTSCVFVCMCFRAFFLGLSGSNTLQIQILFFVISRVFKKTSGNGTVSGFYNIIITGHPLSTGRSAICMLLFQLPEIASTFFLILWRSNRFPFSSFHIDCLVLGEKGLCGQCGFSRNSWCVAKLHPDICEYMNL